MLGNFREHFASATLRVPPLSLVKAFAPIPALREIGGGIPQCFALRRFPFVAAQCLFRFAENALHPCD